MRGQPIVRKKALLKPSQCQQKANKLQQGITKTSLRHGAGEGKHPNCMERVQIPCSSLDIPSLHVVFWPIAWHCFTVLMAHDGPLLCHLFCLFLGSCIKNGLVNPQRLCKASWAKSANISQVGTDLMPGNLRHHFPKSWNPPFSATHAAFSWEADLQAGSHSTRSS